MTPNQKDQHAPHTHRRINSGELEHRPVPGGSLPPSPETAARYLTDGVRLYEIAAQRTVTNYGLRGGTINYTVIRDAAYNADDETAPTRTIDDLMLAALTPIAADPQATLNHRK